MHSINVVFLCAGRGTRFDTSEGQGLPKCLQEVNGEPIINRAIRLLRKKGITDFTVAVSGHRAQRIQTEAIQNNFKDTDVKIFVVEMPEKKGQFPEDVYTFVKCSHLFSDTLIFMGDVVFSEEALDEILNEPFDDLMIIRERVGLMGENYAIRINEKGIKEKLPLIRPPTGLWKHFKIYEVIRLLGDVLKPKYFVPKNYITDMDSRENLKAIRRKLKNET